MVIWQEVNANVNALSCVYICTLVYIYIYTVCLNFMLIESRFLKKNISKFIGKFALNVRLTIIRLMI